MTFIQALRNFPKSCLQSAKELIGAPNRKRPREADSECIEQPPSRKSSPASTQLGETPAAPAPLRPRSEAAPGLARPRSLVQRRLGRQKKRLEQQRSARQAARSPPQQQQVEYSLQQRQCLADRRAETNSPLPAMLDESGGRLSFQSPVLTPAAPDHVAVGLARGSHLQEHPDATRAGPIQAESQHLDAGTAYHTPAQFEQAAGASRPTIDSRLPSRTAVQMRLGTVTRSPCPPFSVKVQTASTPSPCEQQGKSALQFLEASRRAAWRSAASSIWRTPIACRRIAGSQLAGANLPGRAAARCAPANASRPDGSRVVSGALLGAVIAASPLDFPAVPRDGIAPAHDR